MKKTQVDFVVAQNTMWNDLNKNGRVETNETVNVGKRQNQQDVATNFINDNPYYFNGCLTDFEPMFHQVERFSDYLYHPIKDTIAIQLQADIATLESSETLPAMYKRLLEDLRLMLQELPYVRFVEDRYLYKDSAACYKSYNNTIYYQPATKMDVFVHELTHMLIAQVKIDEYDYKDMQIMCDGELADATTNPSLPSQHEANVSFEFELDFPLGVGKKMVYDNFQDYWPDFVQLTLPEGDVACRTEESKLSNLANETYAYQNQMRYILFRGSFDPSELSASMSFSPQAEVIYSFNKTKEHPDVQLVYDAIDRYFSLEQESNKPVELHGDVVSFQERLSADGLAVLQQIYESNQQKKRDFYYEIGRFYIGKGSRQGTLDVWVKDFYESKKHGGFVNKPGCLSISED